MPAKRKTITLCYFCKQAQPEPEDVYCSGCKVHVCSACDRSVGLFGSHRPQDHLKDFDDERD